jgi:hypothetical protein
MIMEFVSTRKTAVAIFKPGALARHRKQLSHKEME